MRHCPDCGRWQQFYGLSRNRRTRADICHACERVTLSHYDTGIVYGTVPHTEHIDKEIPRGGEK